MRLGCRLRVQVLYPSERIFKDLLDITLEGDFTWSTGWRKAGLVRPATSRMALCCHRSAYTADS